MHILITCEHASNFVPEKFKNYFINNNDLLKTHKALDIHAKPAAEQLYSNLKNNFSCSIHLAQITRLLIDHNRSLNNYNIWSEISKNFNHKEKKLLIDQYYQPYINNILNEIATKIVNNTILHISMHSFTNKLNNQIRNNDLGILYDPRRKIEQKFAIILQNRLCNDFKVRRNYPYLGRSDGLTSQLRKIYPEDKYLGYEIEINQSFINWQTIIEAITITLTEVFLPMNEQDRYFARE
jgi:predicted N-formylglutamate amidohydrolase